MRDSAEYPLHDAEPSEPSGGDKNAARLTRGSVSLQLLRLGLPMTIGLFAVIAFNVVDTLYVGQLGPDPLAAMSPLASMDLLARSAFPTSGRADGSRKRKS